MGSARMHHGHDGTEGAAVTTAAPIIAKADTTRSPHLASELLRADAGDVSATTVTMDRSGAEHIEAQRVIMDRSGAQRLEARSAQLDRSGVVLLRSDRAVLHKGSVMVVTASEARLVKSRALAVVSGKTVVEGRVNTLVHVGPAEGDVRPVFDTVGALSFGAALGFTALFIGRLVRRFSGPRQR